MPDSEVAAARILVVEDDVKTADLIALYLRHGGHRVAVEHAGHRALVRLGQESFDLLVLDVMLPAPNGLEICRRVREAGTTPIIFLTARSLEEHRLEGFELGADDYVTKPFSPRELVARVNAVLRRVPPSTERVLRSNGLELDGDQHVTRLNGRAIDLTPSEFALLETLMERPGKVCTRAHLLDRLPGTSTEALDRTIDVHVRNVRRKFEAVDASSQRIETVVGVGYRLAGPDDGRGGGDA